MGGTMRLGADPVKLHDSTAVRRLYGEPVVYERHRHRYEVNNHLRRRLEAAGLICSGTSPDERLVEVIELRPGHAPVLRRLAVPPGVQVAARAAGAAVPGVRGRGARATCPSRSRTPRRCRPPRLREARQRRGARAAARHVRGAVPDREPVGARARVRAVGRRASSGASAWTSRRTADTAAPMRPTCWPASRAPVEQTILLCAHLDTVPPLAPIEPVLVDGGWENANDGILGADNKAAVAVLLELARRLRQSQEPARVGVELLFTVSEENGLHGAKAFDVGRLRSQFGYVFDHASPIGEIVIASPTYHRIVAEIRGRAAHAGIRPEEGRSAIAAAARAIAAMQLGRLDSETTANVGTIRGGTATNVVPERCDDRGRGPGDRRGAGRAGRDRADRPSPGRRRRRRVRPRRHRRADVQGLPRQGRARRRSRSPSGRCARAATSRRHDRHRRRLGRQRVRAAGFPCANLANGTERNHEPGERVSVDALEGMLEVAIALVEEAGAVADGGMA